MNEYIKENWEELLVMLVVGFFIGFFTRGML